MTGMDTSAGVQLGHLNPYVKPQGTGQTAPRDPAINYEDGYTPGAEGAQGGTSPASSSTSVLQIILAAKGKVVGLRVGLTSNPVTPEQTAEALLEVEAQVQEAEAAFATMSAADPDYDNVTQEIIELHLNAVAIAGFAASQLSGDNSAETNTAIASLAKRIIINANSFRQKINSSYISSDTAHQVQNLDLESANAAYELVRICLALGLAVDPDLAALAETAPAGTTDHSGPTEATNTAAWMNDFQADLLNQAFKAMLEMNQSIRDAFNQDNEEERIFEEKKAEERAEEVRIMKKNIEEKLEEIVQAISSVLNNPSLDPATAQKKLGALLDEVNQVISQLTQVSAEMPAALAQNIMSQLNQVKTQLEQLLDSMISEPVGIAQLDEEIGNAAEQLAAAMDDLGMAVDPGVARLASA